VEEPTPFSKEKGGCWLGVAHNVGDALTHQILTDDSQTAIQRSVIRSRNDRDETNKGVTFDPNLDPKVKLHAENQILAHNNSIRFSEIPLERIHKRLRKRTPNSSQNTTTVESVPNNSTTDQQNENLGPDEEIGIANEIEEAVDAGQDDPGDSHDPGEVDTLNTRRSNRQTRKLLG
jgi:hypothetical protein